MLPRVLIDMRVVECKEMRGRTLCFNKKNLELSGVTDEKSVVLKVFNIKIQNPFEDYLHFIG